jgi:aspartyl-tRNA(Asn)/glutamyl-tRNA(Gln) amidotransferase subunit C
MPLTREEVEHVALLGRLELTPEEVERFTGQLNAILDYFEQLRRIDTEGVPPTSHVLPLENVFREDEVRPSLPVEEALQNAPSRLAEAFRVPRVVE